MKELNLLVQVITCWKNPEKRERHIEIPSLDKSDLKTAQMYCELNKITGVLFDRNSLMGNEWYYINGILTTKEKYEEIIYAY